MAGHSKWHNIQRTKGANDAKRSSLFSKLARDISIATKIGGGSDISFNAMLRVVVDKAKSSNMPNDKIQKAINKGMGILEQGEILHYNSYEGYAPGNVPMIIDTETDNPNRTITEIKNIVNKSGGKIVPEGSISWQFNEYGQILLELNSNISNKKDYIENDLMLSLMEIDGVLDISIDDEDLSVKIKTAKDKLKSVHDQISEQIKNIAVKEIVIAKIADNPSDITDETAEKLAAMVEKLEDISEVQSVWLGVA